MTRISVVLGYLVLAVAWVVVPIHATEESVPWPESVSGSGFVPV
jgi:hypothetical protein